MRATQAPLHHEQRVHDPFTMSLMVSVAVHGVVMLGMIGSVWWWGKPTYYKPPSYSVSLVDAPLSLQQPMPAGGGGASPEKPPEATPTPASMPAPPPPPAKRQESVVVEPEVVEAPPKPEPPQKAPEPKKPELPKKQQVEPPQKASELKKPELPKKQQAEPPPTPTPVTVPAKKPPEKQPEPKAAQKPAPPPPSPPASATANEAQQAIAKLREERAREEKAQTQARQAQQAAAQRLAALRERFGAGAGGDAGPGAGAGGGTGVVSDMQRIRLQLYQERIRLQIIHAWILPLPHEEARNLQATALLTVGREGDVAYLKLLQPSGNALFDESLLRAIKHAAPLPPLPEDYQGAFLEVEMRFRPHES